MVDNTTDGEFSVKETMNEAMKDTTDDTQEDAQVVTSTAEKDNVSQDELDNDEGFKTATKELEKEMGGKISFGQSKRFREVYGKYRETERKLKELEEAKNAVVEEEENVELDDNTLAQLAQERGFTLTRAEKKEVAQIQDDLESLVKMAQSPQEQEWLNKYSQAIEKRVVENVGKNLSPILGQVSEMLLERRLDTSEKQARKYIESINKKNGLTIDYDKDIDPELVKMIASNKKLTPQNCDLLTLTKEYLASEGISMGKKLSERSMKELNDKKKAANMEQSDNINSGKEAEFTGVKDFMKRQMNEAGLTSFY